MSALININIADVNFYLSSPESVMLRALPDVYTPFLKKNDYSGRTIKSNIKIELDGIPDIKNATKIFDTEQSWSMFRDGDEYFLVHSPPALNQQVVWLAHFASDFRDATIFCGESMVNRINGLTTVSNPFCYPLDQLLLMYVLAERGGALIHAAGININGMGCIFPGRSGAGKSTLSRQFLGRDTAGIVSDDRVIVRKVNDRIEAFGTPWPGELGIAENKGFSLNGIFFISHSTENMIKEIAPIEAFKRLLPVTSIPWYDKKIMLGILSSCEDLVSRVPAYELYFRPDKEVVDFLEKFVL